MTHNDFWQALRATHADRRPTLRAGMALWTPEEVLACLQSWAQEEGRAPASSDLRPTWQLPGHTTVIRLFGSLPAAWAALGWAYRATGERQSKKVTPAANRHCLKCERGFRSPDVVRIRLCDPCKSGESWEENGMWLTGAVVLDGGDCETMEIGEEPE